MNTKEEFFKWERDKRKIFDEFYKSKGWECKRISGKANKDYDCLLFVNNEWKKVEEKFLSKDYGYLLVETIQDTETNDPGWLYYTKADYIFWGFEDTIYQIDMNKLLPFVEKHGDKFNKKISVKGWGRTENIAIPWYTIIDNKIGERVK